MTTGNKIMWKRGEIAPKEQFLLFSTLFYVYISNFRSQITFIHLLNVVIQFIVFLTLSTLICRSTDISKCFSESLGIRDNESRLYLLMFKSRPLFAYLNSFPRDYMYKCCFFFSFSTLSSGNKYENANNSWYFHTYFSRTFCMLSYV